MKKISKEMINKEIETANNIIIQAEIKTKNNIRNMLNYIDDEYFEQFYNEISKISNYGVWDKNKQDELDRIIDKYFITIDDYTSKL